MIKKELIVNGVHLNVIMDPSASLAALLQGQLQQSVTCGIGDCSECFVVVDGEVVLACTTAITELANGAIITTKKGLTEAESLSILQLAWVVHGSPGCGRCSRKIMKIGAAMLEINPFPMRDEVEKWWAGQSLRCCNSSKKKCQRIDAIMDAARVIRGEIGVEELFGMVTMERQLIDIQHIMPDDTMGRSKSSWMTVPELGVSIPPDTLHLALVRAGVFNAQLTSIEVQDAWEVPGIVKVITSYDVKGSNILSRPHYPSRNGAFDFNQTLICREIIKNKDEVIAVVCADSQQNAIKAARKIRATYKFFGQEDISDKMVREDQKELLCHPQAYNLGFAHLDNNGKVMIHSKSCLPDECRSIIAKAIGLHEDDLELVHGNFLNNTPQDCRPVFEAILGLAFLSTGRPVFLKCSNYAAKDSAFVTVQWSAKKM